MISVPRPGVLTPLVGRAGQVAELRAALRLAASGHAGTVLLAGDAGVGKTRLVEESVTLAEREGFVVLAGHCVDLGAVGLPYLPFAEVLGDVQSLAQNRPAVADGLSRRPALARLAGTRSREDAPSAQADDAVPLQLFDAVGGLLADIAADVGPVLMVLEDLHWADESTRHLLRFLVSRARDQQVLLLGTYRTDDLHRRHPLRPLLAELLRHPTVRRLDVPPFTEAEVRQFVAAAGGDVPEPQVQRVVERSEGNAYFIEELLDADPLGPLPDSLSDVLLARLDRLDPAAHQVARIASVGGRRVLEPLLVRVSGLDAEEANEALREAVTRHVLVPLEGPAFGFRHALLAEAVYSDLLPGERVRLHARYAAALAAGGLGSAAELAHHRLEGQDLAGAFSASLAAADEAEGRLAPTEALRHLEVALSLWDAAPDTGARSGGTQVDLLLRAARAASRCGEVDRATALGGEAVAQAVAGDDLEAEAMARTALAQDLQATDDPDAGAQSAQALRLLVDGIREPEDGEPVRRPGAVAPRLPSGSPSRALLTAAAVHARTSVNSERNEEAERWATWALEHSRVLGLPAVEADVLTTLAVVESADGDPDRAADLLRRAQARAVEAGELGPELRSTYNLAANRYYLGDVESALRLLEAGRRRAEQTGLRWSAWGIEMRVLEVVARYVCGDWDGSESAAGLVGATPPDLVAARLSAAACYTAVGRGQQGALAATEGLRPAWVRDGQIALIAGGCQVDALTWKGRHREAVEVAEQVVSHLSRTWDDYFLGGIWLSALALAALAEQTGRPAKAATDPDPARGRAVAEQLLQQAADTASRGRPRFPQLGPEGRAWLARAHAEHARALGRADVTAWRAAVDAFGEGYPYEQARSRWRLAEALLETGEAEAATREAADALEVAERLGAAPLVAAVRDLARRGRLDVGDAGGEPRTAHAPSRAVLTPRETAVLRLVAQGLTNRQVGEQLFISDKTVSVHLSNLMAKLGASGRTEAVSLAYRKGLLPGAET